MVSLSRIIQPSTFSLLGAAASLALMSVPTSAAETAKETVLQQPTLLAQVDMDSLGLDAGENLLAEAEAAIDGQNRSEEHTSELQSPCNLVCRLLLEKKNTPTPPPPPLLSSEP